MSRGVSRFPRVHSLRSHMHTQRVEYVRTKLESYTFIFAATCILLIGNGEKSLFALAGNSTQKKKYGEPITMQHWLIYYTGWSWDCPAHFAPCRLNWLIMLRAISLDSEEWQQLPHLCFGYWCCAGTAVCQIPLQNLNAVAVRSHSFGEYTDVIFYSFRFADCLGKEDL